MQSFSGQAEKGYEEGRKTVIFTIRITDRHLLQRNRLEEKGSSLLHQREDHTDFVPKTFFCQDSFVITQKEERSIEFTCLISLERFSNTLGHPCVT